MSKLLPVCGPARWVYPATPPHFTVTELCEHVRTNGPDCFVEVVLDFRYGSYRMLVSENGRLDDLPVNEAATLLAMREIRGNALLVTADEFDDLDLLWAVYCQAAGDEPAGDDAGESHDNYEPN